MARLAMVAALIWSGSGWICSAFAGSIILQTPAGLKPGDQFRFVFVTDGRTNAVSSSIADYDSFVQSQAGGATYNGVTVNWLAIGSTSTVNAIDHIGQTDTPVYLVSGTQVTTSTTPTGLWSGSLMHSIDEDITGSTLQQLFPWTGTSPAGVGAGPLFDLGALLPEIGATTATDATWSAFFVELLLFPQPVYGISTVLTVIPKPSSKLLMGTGVGMVVAYGWTRRRRAPSDGRGQR
jgi:hypothetical protein